MITNNNIQDNTNLNDTNTELDNTDLKNKEVKESNFESVKENVEPKESKTSSKKKSAKAEGDLLDDYLDDVERGFGRAERESDFAKYYYDVCNSGDNKFYLKNITETKMFDEEWVKTLEALCPSIDKIIRNPKLTIRYEEEVVVVEKAKKTNSASVRHLASHTQLIREVKDGDVTPKKILTTFAEEEIATYENRFIMTLIERVYLFVKKRHDVIKENVESFQNDHLNYTSNFKIQDEDVELKIDMRIKRDLDNDKINKHNIMLLERVYNLLILIGGFRSSQFMKDMKKARKVNPPIMKTNVILKNPDFRNAYTLWLFLDRYNALGYDVEVRERLVKLSDEFKLNLDRLSAYTYSSLVANKKTRQEDFTKIEKVEPITKKSTKIVKNLGDEVIRRPDSFMVDDLSVNEYYLDLNRKVFNQKVKGYVEEKMKEEAAIKKAIKESIDITNALFDSVFTLDENIDYFEKFITEEDPAEAYEDAKNKLKLAKMIADAKEADYRNSLKLVKSLYKTMHQTNNARLKDAHKQKKDASLSKFSKQVDKDIKTFKKEKERLTEVIDKLEGRFKDLNFNRNFLSLELEELREKMKEDSKKINAEARSALNKELNEINKKHKQKMETLKADLEAKYQKAKEKKAARDAKNKETIKKNKETTKAQAKKKNEEAIAKQKTKNMHAEERLRAMFKAKMEALEKDTKPKTSKDTNTSDNTDGDKGE